MSDGTGQGMITISDRNKAAFLIALGYAASFESDSSGRLNFQFNITRELFEACDAYSHNGLIPVCSYVQAQRYLTDAIHDHRQRIAVRG